MVARCEDEDETISKKRQRTRKFSFHSILDVPSGVPLVDVFAIEISNKKDMAKLLLLLPLLPRRLHHLKRISGNMVLMCEELGEIEESRLSDIKKLTMKEPFLIKVPSSKPKTRAQYEEARICWPTAFHEDKVLEKKLNGCLLSPEQSRLCTDLFFRVEQCSGALIYDPVSNRVVVEETHGDRTRPLHHPVMRLVKTLADQQSDNSHSNEQYLATGYDAFLACEPCTMCAMALVHCRVKRVFFGRLNLKLGALFSRWKLQESKSINHHYQVIRLFEEGET